MLSRLGYEADTCASGIEALRVFEADPTAWDLVLTDQTMPRMSGAELTRELLRRRPDQCVVLCTGFSPKLDEAGARELGAVALLHKPLTNAELAQSVRAALDARRV